MENECENISAEGYQIMTCSQTVSFTPACFYINLYFTVSGFTKSSQVTNSAFTIKSMTKSELKKKIKEEKCTVKPVGYITFGFILKYKENLLSRLDMKPTEIIMMIIILVLYICSLKTLLNQTAFWDRASL